MMNHIFKKTCEIGMGNCKKAEIWLVWGIFVVLATDGYKSSALYHKQIYKTCRVIIPRKAL